MSYWPLPRQRLPWPHHLLDAIRDTPPWRWSDEGPVIELESRVASLLGVEGAVAVDSGRQALALILRSLNLPPGARVAVPAFTFYAVPAVVRDLGFTPVFVDIDPVTCNVAPEGLERVPDLRAAIVTHTFGLPARIAEIAALCERRGIALIEDCAHAFASRVDGRALGSFGTASIFSLETSKQLNAMGGGIAATRDRALHEAMLAQLGESRHSVGPFIRSVSKQAVQSLGTSSMLFPAITYPAARVMSELGGDIENRHVDASRTVVTRPPERLHPLKATLALEQLRDLVADNAKRAELASLLDSLIDPGIPRQRIGKPAPPMLLFTLMPPHRDVFARELLRQGIDTKRDFLSDCSQLFGNGTRSPTAQMIAARALHLPFHPLLWLGAIERIAVTVNETWKLQFPNAVS